MPILESPEQRLAQRGLQLPAPPSPVASYVPSRRVGNLLYLSGQIPMLDGALLSKGPVPARVSVEEAKACARQCVLNALAIVKAELGSLSRVKSVVRVGVFVQCEMGFHQEAQVANGASDLLVDIFGEAGKHVRASVGCGDLPLGAPVEVEFLFELAETTPD
jgi:enamine deaminase RidA (YjgF/YER057c/UK114 family)